MQASSIGVIGGADGPTAVYIASNSPLTVIAGILGALVVKAVLLLIKRH